ncbi:MAG: fluoride efflux transporter CrcB [Hydrogenophilus thermoluteolus]|uniref:fluoride efflux transporter CrcB n=1 Tax=Hydrogenophilus thermoluteolus TaxID=297 RepID=UPI000EE1CEF3|nr:fluoride efflux transporter CrcB [Hydrogenophilus thermoluteolus]MBW7657434.1 fluoride efflux transporter CrcB [Hydrogenophilus thermoluteolus]GLW61246.1 putative fluoride ion transporter CrcB [Hydrogenophilus thermoluteolus]HCO76645.1 fluoride efflux transporter CrcB [Rhodocyclaceae bacterium]HNQ49638.1 fluoride efflux transporter CrcB [Hydrogenophilus thermoluteolus]
MTETWRTVAAVFVGAGFGAVLRWWLGVQLNWLWTTIPLGTLAANLLGGYLIGLALGWFAALPNLAPAWRFLIVTGFCGGLTTFSTFSAELVHLLQHERYGWFAVSVLLHLGGSVAMTFAGLVTMGWLLDR